VRLAIFKQNKKDSMRMEGLRHTSALQPINNINNCVFQLLEAYT